MNVTSKKFYQDGFMDLSRYRLERCELDEDWDKVVERSPQGTIFASSAVLSCITVGRPALWKIFKDRQPVAVLCLVESEDGRRAIEQDLVIYFGLMFEPPPAEQSRAQTIAEQFRITSFCAEKLDELYESTFLSLAPAFVDIRPFLWYNYGRDGLHFAADVRFTSLVQLLPNHASDLEHDPLYLASSKSRRQQIRYGQSRGVTTRPSESVETFIDLYTQTFARQNQRVDAKALDQLANVIRVLIRRANGQLYLSQDINGRAGSAAVFAWDNRRAYYIYGANAPDLRDNHTGTMVLWDALVDLRSRGIVEVDLEGVNSPLRGHFKLSFGGSVTPYYHLVSRR